MRAAWPACAALLLLAGCKEEKATQAAATASPVPERMRQAIELDLRSTLPSGGKARFRGVQVFSQADGQRAAVCGQVSPFADDGNIFVPFVSVITAQGGDPPRYGFEHRVGTSTSEASRVYAALVQYCWDGGGPSASPMRTASPLPPLPDTVPDPSIPEPVPAVAKPSATSRKPGTDAGEPASGTVTVRQSANLHSDPRGGSIRVVPSGTSLKVFARAPGGWVQVGDTAPTGWIHESMLARN